MRVLHVSSADISGGAARAAYRLHRALLGQGVESNMEVRNRKSSDPSVSGAASMPGKMGNLLRPILGSLIVHLQKPDSMNWRSGNWLPSDWSGICNASDAEVVNLHWVGDETLSIADIGRIRKPLVWTLHDMWPFCGMEHYTGDGADARWREGYRVSNRPAWSGGLDLDRLTWQRKLKYWRQPMHIVAPSRWLADCARASALFRDWPVSVIPNTLDTETYQPQGRGISRQALGLPQDHRVVLFGAIGGARDPRKGYDLLADALWKLAREARMQNVLCVVLGQNEPDDAIELPFPVRWMGHVQDDAALTALYSAADVTVVPSRQDNLPQAATESQACGTPVVAFNVGGLPDAVEHGATGYLAEPDSTDDLAKGMFWVLEDAGRHARLCQAARLRALKHWAPEVVAPQYLAVYESISGQA